MFLGCLTQVSCKKKGQWAPNLSDWTKEENANYYPNPQDVDIEVLKLAMCIKLQTQRSPPDFTKEVSEKWLHSEPSA